MVNSLKLFISTWVLLFFVLLNPNFAFSATGDIDSETDHIGEKISNPNFATSTNDDDGNIGVFHTGEGSHDSVWALGQYNVLVVLAEFTDADNTVSANSYMDYLNSSIEPFFNANSYGQVQMNFTYAGKYRLPISKSDGTRAMQGEVIKAIESNYDLAQYNSLLILAPFSCSCSGSGTVGPRSISLSDGREIALGIANIKSSSWERSTNAHELGHNLGAHHSALLSSCPQNVLPKGNPFSTSCRVIEYGNGADLMGGNRSLNGFFSPITKKRLGWMTGQRLTQVTKSGRYTISNYEQQVDTPIALEIPRNFTDSYFIEYRTGPVGSNYSDGILINTTIRNTSGMSSLPMLVYVDPDNFNKKLSLGKTYSDPGSGLSITLVSMDENSATIDVNFSQSIDKEPPQKTFTTPYMKENLNSLAPIQLDISDDKGVYQVDAEIINLSNAARIDLETKYSPPYEWDFDFSQFNEGDRVNIEVRAYDAAGNIDLMSRLQRWQIVIGQPKEDSTPPIISLDEPLNEASLSGTVNLSATASDNDTVRHVSFRLAHPMVNTPTDHLGGTFYTPYELSLDTTQYSDSVAHIIARAMDDAGNIGVSQIIKVYINNHGEVVVPPENNPPVADFTASCSDLECHFDSTSSDSDGSISHYAWNMGDGNNLSGSSINHSYLAAGDYVVTLTVSDDQGATDSKSYTISVSEPVDAPPTVEITSPNEGAEVSGTILIEALASDDKGIDRVQFYVDGNLKLTDLSAPYRMSLDTTLLADGVHTLGVRAQDVAGQLSKMALVNVTINNEPANNPPVADFTASCNDLSCSFSSTSSDGDGSIASYSWNMGDGSSLSGSSVSHAYAAAGDYVVSLTVVDNDGASDSQSYSVSVSEPSSDEIPQVSLTSPSDGAEISGTTIVKATASDDIAVEKVLFYLDGSLKLTDMSSAYEMFLDTTQLADGAHTLGARAIDSAGQFSELVTIKVTVNNSVSNNPPVADFTASCSDLNCSFSSTSNDSDGSIVSYSWNMGDGTSQSGSSVSHSYSAAGNYIVSLTVVDDDGASDAQSYTISVSEPISNNPPIADFTASCSDLSCSFNSTSNDSDGSIVSYSWNMGDGTSQSGSSISHSYVAAGDYVVSLTVVDDDGASDSQSYTVSVSDPAAEMISLSLSETRDKGNSTVHLKWAGAQSSQVDIYRNGSKIASPSNDGSYSDAIGKIKGYESFIYKVCESSSSKCSSEKRFGK